MPVRDNGLLLFDRTNAPKVTQDNACELSDVLTCVRVLAESMASMPLDLYQRTVRGGEKARTHRLQELVRWQPNPEMTSYDLRLGLMVDALLRGNGAAQVIRDGNGVVVELWPLFAAKLTAARSSTGKLMFEYGSGEEKVPLRPEEVLLIPAFSCGYLLSASLVTLGRELLSGAKGAEQYTRDFFANGANLTGIIQVPGDEAMSTEAYERLKKSWEARHTGPGNRHKTQILEYGAQFKPLALNHQETQMIESRQYTRSQIAGLFRVPAHLINDLAHATFSNIEHQDLGLVKHSLRPWMTNFEQRYRMTLLSAKERREEYYFKHNVNDMLRGDMASRMSAYSTGIQNGVWSPNAVLRKEDEPTYEGGDTHFINGNMLPVDTAAKSGPNNNPKEVSA